jgi:hypothetical protein
MYLSRANGANMIIIRDWFAIFYLLAIAKIKPENYYNADEAGVAEGEGKNGIILGPIGRKVML